MLRIWKEGGAMERLGLIALVMSMASIFFDFVDFEALPKTLDKLAIPMPLMVLAWVLILGGQRLRWRKEDRKRNGR